MKNNKQMISILAGVMAAVLTISLIIGFLQF